MERGKNKVIWYVLALVVIIILVMVVFRNEIGFSPRQKSAQARLSDSASTSLKVPFNLPSPRKGGDTDTFSALLKNAWAEYYYDNSGQLKSQELRGVSG